MYRRLSPEDALLIIIDIQGKLAQIQHDRENLFRNLKRMILGVKLMQIPILWLEQYPEGLGSTVPEIAELLAPRSPIAKSSFSACGSPQFLKELASSGRNQLLLTGIEAHVCVCQTALDLLNAGYAVSVVSDAVSSRNSADRTLGLERMRNAGAVISGVEMALYELMKDAKSPCFRDLLKVIK